MTLARTNLIGEMSGVSIGTASYTTAAATTENNSWVVVIGWANTGTTVTAANLTISDSATNTYTSRMTLDATPSSDMGFRVWTAPVTTGASTTWTIDCGADSTDTYGVVVLSYTGADTTGIGATGSNTSAGIDALASITLSGAPATTSECVAFWGVDINTTLPTQTPGSGWTEQYNVGVSGHGIFEAETRTGSTSTTVEIADLNDGGGSVSGSAGLAFEILEGAAAAGDAPVGPPPFIVGPFGWQQQWPQFGYQVDTIVAADEIFPPFPDVQQTVWRM